MMVGPSLPEPVSEEFGGLGAASGQDEKASCGCAESADYPKNIFHCHHSFFRLGSTYLGSSVGCIEVPWRFVGLWQFAGYRRTGGNGYTLSMDSVRFGRALGFGARAAAKTLLTAVDAATAPNPSAAARAEPSAEAPGTQTAASASTTAAVGKVEASGVRLGQQAARTTAQVRETGRGLKEGSKRFGEAVWGPFVKLSGALWLELTGVFFGIFAVFAGSGAWKMRAALYGTPANHDVRARFLISVAMAVLFAYFCVSSFARANRRSRGR